MYGISFNIEICYCIFSEKETISYRTFIEGIFIPFTFHFDIGAELRSISDFIRNLQPRVFVPLQQFALAVFCDIETDAFSGHKSPYVLFRCMISVHRLLCRQHPAASCHEWPDMPCSLSDPY